MHTILGAGSVGLVLGAQLARAGTPVHFVTRTEEAARHIREEGVRVRDAAGGEAWRAGAGASAGPVREIGEGPVFLCVRGPETDRAAAALAAVAPAARVVSVQNGVDNEAILARRFAEVVGGVWRQTCTRTQPNEAITTGRSRIVLGPWPAGRAAELEPLAAPLRAAGLDVGLSSRIEEDLWLKLCVNLMSAPNALVRRPDHATRAFVECKVRLLEEARDVLAAADVPARSCDGRDRSLDEEIRHQREALARGDSARALPLYNQVWTSLRDSRDRPLAAPLEADGYHRKILALAERHGVPAPVNARVLAVLERAHRSGTGPECVAAGALLPPPLG